MINTDRLFKTLDMVFNYTGKVIESYRNRLPEITDFMEKTTYKAQALSNEYFPKILEEGKNTAQWIQQTGWPILENGMVKGIQFSKKHLLTGIESFGKTAGGRIEKVCTCLVNRLGFSFSYLENHPTQAIIILGVSIILGIQLSKTEKNKKK